MTINPFSATWRQEIKVVFDNGIEDISALTPTDGNFIVGDGTTWVAESGSTARTSLGAAGLADNNTFTGDNTFGNVSTDGDDFYSANGAFMAADGDGAFADRSGSNIDHIWHNDAPGDGPLGEWHFCSDTTYKADGNSGLRAATYLSGKITIGDDSVGTVSLPVSGGFAFITPGGRSAFPQLERSGIMLFDVGSSLNALRIGGGANFAVITSAPSGTTGTDGNVTVGVASGQLRIENRFGSSIEFTYTILG